ncbi:Zinc finger protein [Armadillidium vulgare]|nr:Zinc finger protein [Armadillidium vulgare]
MNKVSIRRLMMERIKDKTWKSVYPENSGDAAFCIYYLAATQKKKLPLIKRHIWNYVNWEICDTFRIPRMSPVTISRKQEKLTQNVFEHATICNFSEEKDLLNIAQIITSQLKTAIKVISRWPHARYPFECEKCVWLFIQKNYFEFETEWDKTVSGFDDNIICGKNRFSKYYWHICKYNVMGKGLTHICFVLKNVEHLNLILIIMLHEF